MLATGGIRRLFSTSAASAKQVRENFQRDGVVFLKGLVGAEWIEKLREGAAKNMEFPGPLCDEHAASSGTKGRFHDDQFLWQRHNIFKEFLLNGPAAAAAADLMSSSVAAPLYDHLLAKEPGTVSPTPWHNDYSYWHISGEQICSTWIALDHVSRESMVQYVRGSHKWRLMHAITNFSGEESDDGRYNNSSNPDKLPPIVDEKTGAALGDYDLVGFDMEPGDAVVHHGFTVHGAAGNADLTQQRRGYAVRWIGDDIRFDARPGTMHYNWAAAGYDCQLKDKDPMAGNSELHPLCYTSN